MTSNQELEGHQRAEISGFDMKQVRQAMREVWALHPESVLADLVEEKMRAMQRGDIAPPLDAYHVLTAAARLAVEEPQGAKECFRPKQERQQKMRAGTCSS